MSLHGEHLLGASRSRESEPRFRAVNPADGEALEPPFAEATSGEIDRALKLAISAHLKLKQTGRDVRAGFLERAADGIEALGDALLERASAETGLPMARLTGERGRTSAQLRLFAGLVREGSWLEARIDRAQPAREPLPKPDLRQIQRALGPVVVFGASNFPLAFSVAGGDTASALAAGCPTVVKAHPNHPGTSEMVGSAIVDAAKECGLPEGTFSLLHGAGHGVGLAMVRHPLVRAVGFTGSFAGGKALYDAAVARDVPIPVYAEMGSTNPVFLLPRRLREAPEETAAGLASSVNLGVGQFCTNPGLCIALRDEATATFAGHLRRIMSETPDGVMLHAGIRKAYDASLARLGEVPGVERSGRASTGGACAAASVLLETTAATYLAHRELGEEVFGPSTLVVVCDTSAEMLEVAARLPGQLTATVYATAEDLDEYSSLLGILEEKAGRILMGGFPTGVEVCPSMHHGGPFPATTDSRTTSVGTASIRRFTRPVCYQSFSQDRLPPELRDENPDGIQRLVDGEWSRS